MATQIPLSRHAIDDVYNISARHLQLIRSIPTRSLVSAVVGMKKMDHVRQNLEVIKKPLLTRQEFMEGIKPIKRSEFVEEELDF
jgi:aryl-alcohol dehydrogenase-like predicted oxidoreductase